MVNHQVGTLPNGYWITPDCAHSAISELLKRFDHQQACCLPTALRGSLCRF
jgi:hypothetical protein